MPKRTLRQQLLAARRAFSPEALSDAGRLIQQQFMATPEFVAARSLALYGAIHNEAPTDEVMCAALAAGKEVLFPRVCDGTLRFSAVAGREELRQGRFNIPEPAAGLPCRLPEEIDLIVLPAVAFALDGHRIGYGKGYYDKALGGRQRLGRLVGFCYDFQLLEAIPGEPHDVQVDMIITERRLIRLTD